MMVGLAVVELASWRRQAPCEGPDYSHYSWDCGLTELNQW